MNKVQIKKCYPYCSLEIRKSISKNRMLRINGVIASFPLKNLVSLQLLNISSDEIIDLSLLQNLANLEYLYLNYNRIKDLSPLKNLVNLGRLRLYEAFFPKHQIDELQEALPNCDIGY